MAKMSMLAAAIRRHWTQQDLSLSISTEKEIERLQSICAEQLPEEYLFLLRSIGLPNDEDNEGIRFWPPGEVRPTSSILHELGCHGFGSEHSLVIADYLQESWYYGLWIAGPFKGHVSLVLASDEDPLPPIGTLAEFFRIYLENDRRLYRQKIPV